MTQLLAANHSLISLSVINGRVMLVTRVHLDERPDDLASWLLDHMIAMNFQLLYFVQCSRNFTTMIILYCQSTLFKESKFQSSCAQQLTLVHYYLPFFNTSQSALLNFFTYPYLLLIYILVPTQIITITLFSKAIQNLLVSFLIDCTTF